MREVVVTGIGFVSCLGQDHATVAANLQAGNPGLWRSEERAALGFRSPLTGRILGFDPKALLSRKERRSMSEPALYIATAAVKALEDAAIDRSDLAGPDTGVIVGNDSTCGGAVSAADRTRDQGGTLRLGTSAVVDSMNSSPSINLSVLLKSQGACWTLSAACASGAHAIGQAWTLIATGQQETVVCGGTQELCWESMAGFDGLQAFSTWDGDPAEAVRPFSRDRMGLVPSGGGVALILESRERAEARGARIRATVRGYAFSSDGFHVTSPNGAGAARCMKQALHIAGVGTNEVEYVSAHAAGTPVGDGVEARAILDVFGDNGPPVSSTKSLTGHECWMAGASEVAYALMMAEGGFLAPNRNFLEADEGLEALNVVRGPNHTQARMLLSNSFGFGGTNACVVLEAHV